MRSVFNLLGLAAFSTLFCNGAEALQYNVTVSTPQVNLIFTPNTTFAGKGDTVLFSFSTGFHSVVQGDFATPCHVGSVVNGFSSGFMRVTTALGTTAFMITINDTNPIWFYCSQGNVTTSHCKAGMVGVINPPSSGNRTLAAYVAGARNSTTISDTPALSQGGVNITVAGLNTTTATTSAGASASSVISSVISSISSVASSAASVASSASAAASSSTSKAAAPVVTMTWELLAAAGAIVGGAVAYLQ